MKNLLHYRMLIILSAVIVAACGPTQKGLFTKRTPHEQYSRNLSDAGLEKTQLGALWMAAASKSLTSPLRITVPYKETGYFAADKPDAAGYAFVLKRGEKIVITIATVPGTGILFFNELWKPGTDPAKPEFIVAADTLTRKIEYEIEQDGLYQLRLQPELLKGVEYTLTITTQASLAFPVRSADNPRVTSFWGAARDGGARNHEGIDIFAKFRTPVIASSKGTVTRVNENNLGGKVIFLRPDGKDYSLYYAHLDTQIAYPGQRVNEGEVLGLIGNTGNAKTTAPHLHFGIYTNAGAVDPFPFVNTKSGEPKNILASTANLAKYVRTLVATNIYKEPDVKSAEISKLRAGSIVYVNAALQNFYKVTLPDQQQGFINATQVSSSPLRKQKTSVITRIYEEPAMLAPEKIVVGAGEEITILGTYNEFQYILYKEMNGWIAQ